MNYFTNMMNSRFLRYLFVTLISLVACFTVLLLYFHESDDLIFDSYDLADSSSISDISLSAGVYDISVIYDYSGDSGYGIITVEADDTSLTHALDSNVVLLPYYSNSVDFPIYLNKSVNNISVNISSSGDFPVTVCNMSIHKKRLSSAFYFLYNIVLIISIFFGIPYYLYRLYKNPDHVRRIKSTGLILLMVFLCIPCFIDYLPGAVDLYIHLNRLEGIANGLLTDHVFPVRIHSNMWNNYGYPFGVFYGDILYYIPALLYMCGLPLWRAYRAYVIFINALTVIISYHCFYRIGEIYSDDQKRCCITGLFASAIFCLNMWHISALYGRAAVGAYTSYSFIPLVLTGITILVSDKEYTKKIMIKEILHKDSFYYISLGFIGIALSHMLTLFIMILGLLILSIIYILIYHKDIGRIVCNAKTFFLAAILSVMGSLGYLLPVFHMSKTHDLYISNFTARIQEYGVYFAQLFMVRYNTLGLATPISGLSEDWPQTMGLALLGCGFIGIYLILTHYISHHTKPIIILVLITCISVFMASPLFPYDTIQDRLPYIFSILGKVQTSNRYLLLGTISLCVIGIIVLQELYEKKERKTVTIYLTAILTVLLWQGIIYYSDYLYEAPIVTALSADDAAVLSYSDDTLYTFNGIDIDAPFRDYQIVTTDGLQINNQSRHGSKYNLSVTDSNGSGGYICFPVYAYIGYQVSDSSGNKFEILETDDHRIEIQLPKDYSGDILLQYKEPVLWRIAEIISVFTLGLLIIGASKIKTPNR